MNTVVDTREAYENLANAIIKQAADDYVVALLAGHKGSKKKDMFENRCSTYDIDSLERFFRSDFYKALTKVDGEYLIQQLRIKAEERRHSTGLSKVN